MAPDDDVARMFGILERIDERTIALREGADRVRGEVDILKAELATVKGLLANYVTNLELTIDERIRLRLENRSVSTREWVGFGVAALALLLSVIQYINA